MAKRKPKQKSTSSKSFSLRHWWQNELGSRGPILKFWLGFAGVMALFYVLAVQPFYVENIQEPVSSMFASVTSGILNLFGQDTTARGMDLVSPQYSLSIKKGCDSIAPIMLVVAGILLFPAEWKKKLLGIGIGIVALFTLNLVRIISLWFIGLHAPDLFEFMHIEFWQVVFIGLAIGYFFYWLNWASKPSDHAQAA